MGRYKPLTSIRNSYTLKDLKCEYCLHYKGKKGCAIERCCCEQEKKEALRRAMKTQRE